MNGNRHGLALRRRVGEAASANIANVELARHEIPIVLALLNARPQDVFNADETGIVFGAQPHKTLAAGRVSGVKRVADRIIVMLCCNATGSERLKPLVIGKASKPRCCAPRGSTPRFNPSDYVHYFANAAAWCTREIFNSWLLAVQQQMMEEDGTIFLLVDKCSAHRVTIEPSTEQEMHGIKLVAIPHVFVIDLPPNCTSFVQPLDQGIIYSFKARYRVWYLRWLLGKTNMTPSLLPRLTKLKPDLKEGILCLSELWASFPAPIIQSCWRRADVLPLEEYPEGDASEQLRQMQEQERSELTELITALPGDGFWHLYH